MAFDAFFTVPDRVTDAGVYTPIYTIDYSVGRYVSGWSFKPHPPASSTQQPSSDIGASGTLQDAVKTKKPKTVLGEIQSRASAGDTVPIVFGFRTSPALDPLVPYEQGGVWIQPTLVKTGSRGFEALALFAVSQGDLYGTLSLDRIWVGNRNMRYTKDLTTPFFQYYFSNSASEAAPTVCPITGGRIFCDYGAYQYLSDVLTTSGGTIRRPDIANNYYYQSELTKGTGDTNNSVIRYDNNDIEVYDSATGTDVTAAYWAYLGINPASTYTYINAEYSGSTIIGGRNVGTVKDINGSWVGTYASPTGSVPYSTGPVVFTYGAGTLFNQINAGLPADTGTLYGVITEWGISPYADPTSPPAGKNFTNFSDITFLEVWGNLYDPNNGNVFSGIAPDSWPSSFKQLSVFYEYGVKVDLYSAGLVGGVYLNGPSDLFVDLAMYLFTLMKRANGEDTDSLAAPIDTSNLSYLASFNRYESMRFNGIVDQSVNVVDYISKTAPYFFLQFISSNGRYNLEPLLPVEIVSGNVQLKTTAASKFSATPGSGPIYPLTFDENFILPGSFQKKYFNAEDRRPVRVSILWRDANPAAVSIQRTTTVRYPDTDSNAPVVQFDMTDFCCTPEHATKYAKYELARRKYSTHAISFAVQLGTAALTPANYIEVSRQRVNSRGDNRVETGIYQVTRVTHTVEGVTNIEAAYFPINASNIFIINDEIVNGTFTVT